MTKPTKTSLRLARLLKSPQGKRIRARELKRQYKMKRLMIARDTAAIAHREED
jgi:hypothetical protein